MSDTRIGIVDWSYYAYRGFFRYLSSVTNLNNIKKQEPPSNFFLEGLCAQDPVHVATKMVEYFLENMIEVKTSLGYGMDPLLMCFDATGSEFRKRLYPDYKGHRASQYPLCVQLLKQVCFTEAIKQIKKMCRSNGWIWLEQPGFEADDLVYVACKKLLPGEQKSILASDKDYYQLVDKYTSVIWEKRNRVDVVAVHNFEVITRDTKDPKKHPGFKTPSQFLLAKILDGDTSDNITGYPGIGPKTAKLLALKYGSFKNIMDGKPIDPNYPFRGEAKAVESIQAQGEAIYKRNRALIDLTVVGNNYHFQNLVIDQFNKQAD